MLASAVAGYFIGKSSRLSANEVLRLSAPVIEEVQNIKKEKFRESQTVLLNAFAAGSGEPLPIDEILKLLETKAEKSKIAICEEITPLVTGTKGDF